MGSPSALSRPAAAAAAAAAAMGSEDVLVEIHPRELQFLFELKKQSSCYVNLVNKSDQHVAFKVKTTSPKRYCVRPNVGVILPLASRDFTVTMQAPKNAPPDLQIKDKFLVQTTVVPFGTTDEDIVPAFFSKETNRYIEEKKLKVVLVSMTHQPQVEQHINGVPHAEETVEDSWSCPNAVNEVLHSLKGSFSPLRGSPPTFSEISSSVKESPTVPQDFPVPPNQASLTLLESASNLQQTSAITAESHFSWTETSADLKYPPFEYTHAPIEVSLSSDTESTNTDNIHTSHVTEDVHTLQIKLYNIGVKLKEAETVILRLEEETRTTIQERDKIRKEMVFLKRAGTAHGQSSTGFPLLFVIYMAVVGMSLGYLLHL